jgi:hypothetical protein
VYTNSLVEGKEGGVRRRASQEQALGAVEKKKLINIVTT